MSLLLKWLKRIGIGLLLLALGLGLYYWLTVDNIHTVISQQVYRSAQLPPDKLKKIIEAQKIKSVMNLRGEAKGQIWYDTELATTNALGIKHFDIHLKAHTKPSPEELRRLVILLQAAPHPVLIHCKGGADRTGLASALILLLQGKTFEEANRQISWRYYALSRDSVGRLVMPYYACYLNRNNQVSTQQNFLEWVASPKPYDACLSFFRE